MLYWPLRWLLLILGACYNIIRNSVHDIEKKYYADGEDAYAMRKDLKGLFKDEDAEFE